MNFRVSVLACAASLFISLLWGTPSSSLVVQSGASSIFVDSDKYQGNEDSSAQLTGHVKVIRNNEQLTADKAFINPTKNEVTAEGHVLLLTPKDYIRAEKIIYNFVTKKGIIYNGFIQTGQETIEGAEIYKLGDDNYQAKDASYTSCVNCPPSWKVSGSNIDASVGSYAYVTKPVIRLYGAPVLWLPYMVIPIKTERQSGLLAPTPGFGGSNGTSIQDSYFWAIDRSHDATIGGAYYDKRGGKGSLEYRFVPDKNSFGSFQGNFIDDRGFGSDPNYTTPDPRYVLNRNPVNSISRYSLHYAQHFELPENFVNNINLNDVSDTRYPIDFPLEMPFNSDAALENRVSVYKNTENTHSSFDADLYESMIRADPVGQNSDAIHRLPELEYSIQPTRFGNSGFLGRLNVDYVNFARASSDYDKLSGSNNFQMAPTLNTNGVVIDPADQYRTGQRLSINPTVSYPFNVGDYLDLLPEVAFSDTLYQFGYSPLPTTDRQYIRGTLDAKTNLNSVFGDDKIPGNHRYKHAIQPEISYTFVPYLNQGFHPFLYGSNLFGQKQNGFIPHYSSVQPVTEYDTLQFDYRDRMTDLNLLTFGVTNIITQKKTDNGISQYRQVIKHQLFQSYDFYAAYGANTTPLQQPINNFPWSELHSVFQMTYDYFELASDLSYYWYQSTLAHTTSLTFRDKNKDALQLSLTQAYNPLIDPNTGLISQQTDPTSVSRAASIATYFNTKYLELGGNVSYDLVLQALTSYGLNALFKPSGQCFGIDVVYTQTLNGSHNFLVTVPIFFGNGKSLTVGRPAGI